MAVDHCGELSVRFEALPAQPCFPVVEELPGPRLGFVVPQLIKLLAQQIGRIQPFIRLEQELEAPPAFWRQIFLVREQNVFACFPRSERRLPGRDQ